MAYEDFFHLKDAPFRMTPDPDYYFPSDVHKEALETLIYSVRAGEGFVQITGHPGTGKTLLIRTLLRRLGDEVALALVLNPSLSPEELMRVILEDLGGVDILQTDNLPKEKILQLFREFLLKKAKQGIKTIVIIDESQNLPNNTLEELRLLSNLETEKEKLLQIILVGQIELEEKLKSPDLKQLAQRITIRYRLKPLSREDTFAYIRHRLEVAGGMENVRFAPTVLNKIYKFSLGIPRRINIVCERALMAAFVDGKMAVTKKHTDKAIQSIDGEELGPAPPGGAYGFRPAQALVALLVLVIIGGGYFFMTNHGSAPGGASQESAGTAGMQPGDGDKIGDIITAFQSPEEKQQQLAELEAAAKKELEQEKEKRLAALANEVASEKENRLSTLQNELAEQQRAVAAELEQEKTSRLVSLKDEVASEKENRLSALQKELAEKQRAVAEELQQERQKRLAALETEIASEKQKKLSSLQKELAEQQRTVAAELEQEKVSRLASMKNEVASEKETRLSALQKELAEKQHAVAEELEQEKQRRLAALDSMIASEKEEKLSGLQKELAAQQQAVVAELKQEKEKRLAAMQKDLADRQRVVEEEINRVREASRKELTQWQGQERARLEKDLAAEKERLAKEKEELTASIASLAAEKERILAEQKEAARQAELAKLASLGLARSPHEELPLEQIVTTPPPEPGPESSAPGPDEQVDSAGGPVVTSKPISSPQSSALSPAVSPQTPAPSAQQQAALSPQSSVPSPAVEPSALSPQSSVLSPAAGAQQQASLSPQSSAPSPAVTTQSSAPSPAVKPLPSSQYQAASTRAPLEVFSVPAGRNFIVVDRKAQQMFLWQGKDPEPVLVGGYAVEWPMTEGVYILGKHARSGDFLFNPMTFFWGLNTELAASIWKALGSKIKHDIVPVLVYSDLQQQTMKSPAQFYEILQAMNSWAEAWRAKNLDHLITYYGDIFTHYEVDRSKPIIYARDQLKEVRGEIFAKSGEIRLDISTPLCLVDPLDPRTAIAVFRQGYGSKVYSDRGVKTLYFRLMEGKEGTQTWKIVAKLWVPE